MNNQTLLTARGVLEQPVTRLLDLILLSFILLIAISTILLMIGLQFSAKFSGIASLILLSAILIGVSTVYAAIKLASHGEWKRIDIYCLLWILLISLLGAMLSASINRPDIDDSIYAPKAVFYTEHPSAPLNRDVDWITSPDKTPVTGVFPYYELIQAAFSWGFERNYLDFYHVITPGIVGFFICLSMYLLLRVFEHRQGVALLSILFFILLLMALGETHRTPGNFSFARAFQGKTLFLSVGIPSWVYFSLRYFLMRDRLSWIALIALGVGMAGVTTTAMVFLPFLSLAIIASYYFNEGKMALSAPELKLAVSYFTTLTPLLAMAIDFRSYAIKNVGSGSFVVSAFSPSFGEQMRLLINPDYPLTPIVFTLAITVVILFSGYRKFFIFWIAIIITSLLNPLISDFVIKNLTTEAIYWRLIYLLPFPLVACVAYSILVKSNWISKAFTALLFALLVPAAFWGPTSVLRAENNASWGLPGYKIGSRDLFASQGIISRLACGPMFAPMEISSNILLLASCYPQFHMREDYLGLMLKSIERPQEFNERVDAYAYLYNEGSSDKKKLSLLNILKGNKRPQHVVVRVNSANRNDIIKIMLQEGYESRFFIDERYEIFSVA